MGCAAMDRNIYYERQRELASARLFCNSLQDSCHSFQSIEPSYSVFDVTEIFKKAT